MAGLSHHKHNLVVILLLPGLKDLLSSSLLNFF